MRLAVFTLSAVLLSGCSWLGGAGSVFNGGGQGHYAQGHHSKTAGQYQQGAHYKARAQHGQHQYRARQDPCQVYSPQAPIPHGCHPSQVTLGTAGGFPQQPNFGGGQYANQGYGSHAGVAAQQAAHYNPRKSKMRKPRFRGSLSLGVEKSVSGDLLNYATAGVLDPTASYNPQDYNEGAGSGSQATGSVTRITYTAADQGRVGGRTYDPVTGDVTGLETNSIFTPNDYEKINNPDISFDDVYSTPVRISGGMEYVLNPRTTLFANAGYSHAEGNSGTVSSVQATAYRETRVQAYTPELDALGDPIPGSFIESGAEARSVSFIPNQEIATFAYDFTDMKRADLEVGARHYFNPVVKSKGFKTLTPFVGAAVGASHYNGVSYDVTQRQSYYTDFFDNPENLRSYEVVLPAGGTNRVDLYDSQWVPSGQLNAGMEWQVTPKTAFAFETGVRVEGARKYSNGERGDKNIAIPMTIRGSYNF